MSFSCGRQAAHERLPASRPSVEERVLQARQKCGSFGKNSLINLFQESNR